MNIVCIEGSGSYRLYGLEITEQMSNMFPELKSAYVCFYADSEEMAKAKGEKYYHKIVNNNREFSFDTDKVRLEFATGKIVEIWNSEWGGVQLVN